MSKLLMCLIAMFMVTNTPKEYMVHPLSRDIDIDAKWDKSIWSQAPSCNLEYFMGHRPNHIPNVEFKLLYDLESIYIIFKVVDRYVKALSEGYQSSVCQDSCVEFFFTPQQDVGSGYFNLETNCGGTILMYHQVARNYCSIELSDDDLDQIQIASSLPKLITEEITQPITWTLEYKLPFSILAKYTEVIKPARGVEWKANFYKCADRSSHPHWLTWSIVDLPKPDFHRPEFFGTLIFC